MTWPRSQGSLAELGYQSRYLDPTANPLTISHSFIHSFDIHLLSTSQEPKAVTGSENTKTKKTQFVP